MIFLLVVSLVVMVIAGVWATQRWHRQHNAQHFRQQAQLHAIEGQMAGFQAALRLKVAEHATRQRMRDMQYEPDSTITRLDANEPWRT